ncbi:MAG: response regulator [Lachnospiraceae bacterium]|nr:response regulator [Lachnospiraceae bacterium]
MGFRYIIVILVIASILCLVESVSIRRRNPGLILMESVGAVANIICFGLLSSNSVEYVRLGLIIFLFAQSWLYFNATWAIAAMGRYRSFKRYLIPIGVLSLYQSSVILSSFAGNKVFSLARHIYLGRTWWIAEAHRGTPPVMGLEGYYAALAGEALIMLIALLVYSKNTDKLFRGKYYYLFLTELVYLFPEFMSFIKSWPTWTMGISINVCCFIWHYYVNYYSVYKLRSWSLLNFANDMSDGFILYDEYDDPVYMNDVLKNTFTEELKEDFKDKDKLDKWLADTITIADSVVRRYEKSDGEGVYFRTRKNELNRSGFSLGTIYILHDSTDSVLRFIAMEEANRELERAARMKSDFLANMSHEIRTPMNAVIGMAELSLREDLPPKVADYLTQIKNSGRNLLNIINDILDFSKIEAGKMEIVQGPYEPLSEINDIANVLMTRIGEKNLELFVDVDASVPHLLEGDAMRIRQILINLSNNAIKFTQEGIVCIKLACERFSDTALELTYHVTDTGVGIKEEDIEKLFRNFEQIDSKRNRSVEGTGLGLAISKSLCEAMGGSIGVKSEYGKGSDFYFSIPQRILDPSLDIVIKDAQDKYAFVINDKEGMVEKFKAEMNKLSVSSGVLESVDDYKPSGKKDYVFFEAESYDDKLRTFLDANKGVTGVILVGFDSDFKPDRDNLRVMRRPQTTLAMLSILNDREEYDETINEADFYRVDFTAPDATALIVDDNLVNITITEGLLESTHIQCTHALSGMEAIELIKENEYDIVFMDHMMPEMDGIEATHIIRETIPAAANVPIIALTANVMEGVKDMFISEGMNDFVGKPIEVKTLMSTVRRWIPADKIIESSSAASLTGTTDSAGFRSVLLNDKNIVEYACLDYETAIEVLGNVALYNRIVEDYYRSGADKAKALDAAYKTEDWQDYTIKVHALKSSSRQIGAMELGDMAERLEKAGHEDDLDTINENHAGLMEKFDILLGKLSGYFTDKSDEITPDTAEQADAAVLKELSDRLYAACDELDMDGMEAVKNRMKEYRYPEAVEDIVKQLYKAIDNVDTDECIRLMDRILKGQGEA